MDNKNTQILRELDINSRQSNSKIAKKARLKKETVNYIIKKLEKKQIILGYFALINYFKLGSNLFKLLIRYENIGEKGESRLIDWLSKREEVVWIGKTEGIWDLIITLRQKEIGKMYLLLENFNKKFSKNIKEKQLLLPYELKWFNEKYLYNSIRDYYDITLMQKDKKEKIDETDKKIIGLLEHNARIPIVDIAKNVKLTAQATAKRINILLKKNIVAGFKLRFNLPKLEKGHHHIFASLRDFSKIDEIVDYYKLSKNCVFIMKYHGIYDFHLEFVSNSQNDFRRIIKDFREKFGNYISEYSQLMILEESKLA